MALPNEIKTLVEYLHFQMLEISVSSGSCMRGSVCRWLDDSKGSLKTASSRHSEREQIAQVA